MFDHLRDIANVGVEMAALRDERIRLCKEVVSMADLTMRIMEITRLRNQYLDIANWMILDQLIKGEHTEKDKKLGQYPPVQIVLNRIDNNGKTTTDKNVCYRNEFVISSNKNTLCTLLPATWM